MTSVSQTEAWYFSVFVQMGFQRKIKWAGLQRKVSQLAVSNRNLCARPGSRLEVDRIWPLSSTNNMIVLTHTHTHTHIYIYIYIYMCVRTIVHRSHTKTLSMGLVYHRYSCISSIYLFTSGTWDAVGMPKGNIAWLISILC